METASGTSAAILISGLKKSYRLGFLGQKRRVALEALDLRVPHGEVFGYLGPNGSGKTTTLKILMGLISADAGELTILGHRHEDNAWRYRTGYLPEHPYFYDYLTPREYLDYVGRLLGLSAERRRESARQILELLGLERAADLHVRRFSKGMVQRLGLAQALINDPDLVFLDEPMSGLDPLGRRLVRNAILEMKQRGKTVFFSTHILSDAEALCDRVALLNAGRLLASGRLDEILKMDVSHFEVLVSGLDGAALPELPATVTVRRLGERLRLDVAESSLTDTIALVERNGGRILGVHVQRQSLEDYFLHEVGAAEPTGGWVVEE